MKTKSTATPSLGDRVVVVNTGSSFVHRVGTVAEVNPRDILTHAVDLDDAERFGHIVQDGRVDFAASELSTIQDQD